MTTAPHKPALNAGVMGWPISHSLSPRLHGYWIEQYGLEAGYTALPVEPENLENALLSLHTNGFAGCNLTLPHKEAAIEHMSELSKTAREIGAVNTVVVREDGSLFGDNTDAEGFIQSLTHQCPEWKTTTKTACVIGSGGAAKAIVVALKNKGIDNIIVANRTVEKAAALSGNAISLSDIGEALPKTDLLVNTTSLGMAGQPPLEVDVTALPEHAIVSDIVYNPRITPLLKAASARGLKTAEGIDMLLYQAVRGFHYWFRIEPEVTEDLRIHVLTGMKK